VLTNTLDRTGCSEDHCFLHFYTEVTNRSQGEKGQKMGVVVFGFSSAAEDAGQWFEELCFARLIGMTPVCF